MLDPDFSPQDGDILNANTAAIETMATYTCHKQVKAAKIRIVRMVPEGHGFLLFENSQGKDWQGPLMVSAEYMRKHQPQPGGYYVRYRDGYESFSPAEAFEEGYTIDQPPAW